MKNLTIMTFALLMTFAQNSFASQKGLNCILSGANDQGLIMESIELKSQSETISVEGENALFHVAAFAKEGAIILMSIDNKTTGQVSQINLLDVPEVKATKLVLTSSKQKTIRNIAMDVNLTCEIK
jgi:hypothetical protein